MTTTQQAIIDQLITDYTEPGTTILVKPVTPALYDEVRTCAKDNAYIQEEERFYEEPEDPSRVTWVDIEGFGYGWVWALHREETWHAVFEKRVHQYLSHKESEPTSDATVLVVTTPHAVTYHFVERDAYGTDRLYSFSNHPFY